MNDERIDAAGTERVRHWPTVVAIAAVALAVPLVGYWWIFARGVASVTPPQAKRMLADAANPAVLVDVRPASAYALRRIDGAESWPMARIDAVNSPGDVPEPFRGKRLLLLCEVGGTSAQAARRLASAGVGDLFSVRGGIQEWIGSVGGPAGGPFDRWRTGDGEVAEFPVRDSPLFEQVLAVAAGMGVKAVYTLLSLVLAIVLWRRRSADLAALRWGMIFFFLGENACAANYWLFNEKSYLFEYFHQSGMLLAFGFFTFAVLEGFDRRVLHLSEPGRRCAAVGLCARCIKNADVPCGLKRMFYVLIPALILLCGMPLAAPWRLDNYNTMIFGTFYHYTHRLAYQLFEVRYCPVAAAVLLAVSLLVLRFKRVNAMAAAKVTFSAGVGALGFGFFRMLLAQVYGANQVWFTAWEELTELLFISGVAAALWIFRHALFSPLPSRERGRG